ncbi:MAG: thioesterase family protein [Deltaproteobacteria bacterium]|nr:thioesterase family protein [Deltaproteobacteria bacterium]MBW2666583.1 thioesterase family protein [Deltaproteobacteria bacterium]
MSFDEDTAVHAGGPGVYSCEISPKHWVVAGPNGGYLAALLTRAGEEHLADQTRQLRSLTVHYLRPPKAEPARIEVTTEQLGRSVAYLRLTMIQAEKTVLLATGAWATEREGFAFDSWTKPQADAPESCSPLTAVRGAPSVPIHQQWDIRSATGAVFGSGQPPDLSWWIRPRLHRSLDAPMIAAIADALPPPIFVTEVGPMAIPTIDLTVHIRAELPMVKWEPGDWVLTRFSTRYASGGFLEEDGELWTADGTLLAHSRQLALSI